MRQHSRGFAPKRKAGQKPSAQFKRFGAKPKMPTPMETTMKGATPKLEITNPEALAPETPKMSAPSPKAKKTVPLPTPVNTPNPNIPKKKRSDYEGTSFIPYTSEKQEQAAKGKGATKGKTKAEAKPKEAQPKPVKNVQRRTTEQAAPRQKRPKMRRATDLLGKVYAAQFISGGARAFANTARKLGGL